MTRTRKFITGATLGLLTLVFVAALAISLVSQPASAATPAQAQAQTTPVPTQTTPASPGANPPAPNKAGLQDLRDSFVKNFAAALGVDVAKLNSAFQSAAGTTVDQAVKDGKLTQAQADKIKEAAKNGFQGQLPGRFGGHDGRFEGGKGLDNSAIFDAAAKTIGITTAELKTDLQNGQSIADVAKAKNVDLAKVKDASLAALKTELDAKVKAGTLTQAQADTMYQGATTRIDAMLSNTHQRGRGHK